MSGIGEFVQNIVTVERALSLFRGILILVVGFILVKLLTRSAYKALQRKFKPQEAQLFRRLVQYGLSALVVVTALHQLGFNPGVLLGAAGVLTVAVGFASQTSASNLVSGLFLIAERPFEIGDVIVVDDVAGEVLSIDLLSVKLRTFDNLYVRIANEQLIKSRVTNRSHFPIRRVDIQMGVAYREDLDRVRDILFDLADRNVLCMGEPKPLFMFTGFGDSALQFQFSVRGVSSNFLALKNSLQNEIKRALDDADIEIPFPQRTLTLGKEADPLPVSVVPSS